MTHSMPRLSSIIIWQYARPDLNSAVVDLAGTANVKNRTQKLLVRILLGFLHNTLSHSDLTDASLIAL